MVQQNGRAGINGSNGHAIDGAILAHDAQRAWQEAQGATPLGPFEYVPPMGFREYWYPGVSKKDVGTKKPVFVKMLGEDIVFFRGKAEKVYALFDWCPHRSARLSQGESVFPGTITCEYHGYTFDGQGECVAGLIDDPNTPLVGRMKGSPIPRQSTEGLSTSGWARPSRCPWRKTCPPRFWMTAITGTIA